MENKCDEFRTILKVARKQHSCASGNKNRTHFVSQTTYGKLRNQKMRVKLLASEIAFIVENVIHPRTLRNDCD